MKLLFLLSLCTLQFISTLAQTDSTAFRATIENKEMDIYMKINFYDKNIIIPGQEYYGQLAGYLGKVNNPFCWVVVDAELQNGHKARLTLINDYGSEDLTATLERKNDSVYVLRQGAGSALKVPRNGKWFKLPKVVEFIRKE